MMLSKDLFNFLEELSQNNHRTWFEEHKNEYLSAKSAVEPFVKEVQTRLNQTDVIEYSRLYRIYRDVRFSKDKLPYKEHFGGYFRRFGNDRRGSYTFKIDKNGASVGGGFYGPNAEDLLRIRKEFELDLVEIPALLADFTFVDYFGTLQGERVKTMPRGFDKELPNIDLIRQKQFYVFRTFTQKEVLSTNFVEEVVKTYLAIRPFFDYMTRALTTDLNGESIL